MITAEPEAEVSAGAPARSPSDSPEAGTLVEVSFQKNTRQKYKYLEGEPKILGITEIAIAVFFIGWRISFYLEEYRWTTNVTILFASFGIIAGSVAIAAQNLHLPTLKACLGMQVVTSLAYFVCVIFTLNEQHFPPGGCWIYHEHYHEHIPSNSTCLKTEKLFNQLFLLDELLELVQISLAITLASYCCKVIPCCSPRSNVPVIVMAPPAAPE